MTTDIHGMAEARPLTSFEADALTRAARRSGKVVQQEPDAAWAKIAEEAELILTDPDSTLSDGAFRALQWMKAVAAKRMPDAGDRADATRYDNVLGEAKRALQAVRLPAPRENTA